MNWKSKCGLLLVVIAAYFSGVWSQRVRWAVTRHLHPTVCPSPALETAKTSSLPLIDDKILDQVRGGVFVILFRHALAETTRQPGTAANVAEYLINNIGLKDMGLKRIVDRPCLSVEGTDQSQVLRATIQTLQIPVGEVFSSPSCRAQETARLVFGRVNRTVAGLSHWTGIDANVLRTHTDLIAQPAQAGKNRVIVGHGDCFANLGIGIPMLGEMEGAIVEVRNGRPQALARITLWGLARLAGAGGKS